ncbi:MAG: hypothetical protein WC700_13620 [Gemmatimonadaceae bacterium]|jgi:hypothetical protein
MRTPWFHFLGGDALQRERGAAAVTDAEWAVALAREAAMALFVVRARPRQNGGDAHADLGRPGAIEPSGRESLPAQPTVR